MSSFLRGDLYTIRDQQQPSASQVLYTFELNAKHPLFEGHFPQMPILPGVCQTQIIKELLEDALKVNLQLNRGNNIKFTGMILPEQHHLIQAELNYRQEEQDLVCEARLFDGETVFTKFKGKFLTR